MNIKKRVKLSFVVVIILTLLVAAVSSVILYQMKEINASRKNISNLVYLQEKMNDLVHEIIDIKLDTELEQLSQQFISHEKEFEIAKEDHVLKNKNDLMDLLIEDLHEYSTIKKALQNLFINEKNIESSFDAIYELEKQKLQLEATDSNHPKLQEIETLTKDIVNQILAIIDENKQVNLVIENELQIVMDNFTAHIIKILTTLLVFTIGFILIIAYKVNKNVGLSVDEIEQKVKDGLEEIQNLNEEIQITQREVVFTMGAIGESRSKETGNHVKRVAEYSKLLAIYCGIEEEEAEMLKQASPMHDIGKVAIPDAILNKPAKFDAHEREIMNTHAKLGYEMLKHSNRELLKAAAIVAYEHHEKWDGSGYPRNLQGTDIHIYGRITALADVFDALGSDRVYKKAWEDEKIFHLFKEERAKHFDPKLIDIFFENLDEFLKIRERFRDNL